SVFIYIKVAASRATLERSRTITYQAFAIARELRPLSRKHLDNLFEDPYLPAIQFNLTVAVVHKQNAGRESHLDGERDNLLSILRWASADNAANHDRKTGVIPEPLETFLQVIQNLLRRFVAVNSVNGDLHFLQPCLVERFNHFWAQKETIGDHAGTVEAKLSARANNTGKIRVQCGFAAGERNAKRTELLEFPQ